MIWNPEHQTVSRSANDALQRNLLRRHVSRAYERVPHYRQLFRERGMGRTEHVIDRRDVYRG